MRLSREAGFTQPQVVELFRWDVELVSQLQQESQEFVLKGGAAAQFYITVEKQRGSVDVDLVYKGDRKSLSQTIGGLREKFASQQPLFQFEEYVPKKPTANLPMQTYDVTLPSVLSESCRIKLDILFLRESIPTQTIHNARTFAGTAGKVICSSKGALVGDKLLTLATRTIGIQKIEDYPKQIYDLEMLGFQGDFRSLELADLVSAVKVLTPLEASFRGLSTSLEEALQDVEKSTMALSHVDLTAGDENFKKAINDFQQFYVPGREMGIKLYEWSCRILRVRFLASLINLHLTKGMTVKEMDRLLSLSKSITNRAKSLRGEAVVKSRAEVLKVSRVVEMREMRGKPLERAVWQVATPDNLDALSKII